MGQTDRDRVRWRARDETRRKRMRVREERPREPADGAHGALMGRMGRTEALNWETAAKQTCKGRGSFQTVSFQEAAQPLMERRCQCSCCRRSTTEELAEQLLSRLSAKSLSSAQLPLIVKLREALVTCEAQILSSVAPSIVAPRLRASWWHGAQPELKRRLLRLPEPMSISPRAAQRESAHKLPNCETGLHR